MEGEAGASAGESRTDRRLKQVTKSQDTCLQRPSSSAYTASHV